MDPITAAQAKLAQGDAAGATALLAAAGDAGNAEALAELAIWHIGGRYVARDLPAARALLRRAATIGHVDAALMEIALTANGSGAPADWPAALALLRRAATTDPLAAQHLELLGKMAITPQGEPARLPAPLVLHRDPLVQRFPGFCTPIECAHIASVAAPSLQPATVFDPASGRMIAHPIRASDNAPIGPTQESLVVQAINRRIAAATGTVVAQGEPLTVLRYGPGQQYKLHLDTLPGQGNQRIRTAILYINHNFAGGETVFPDLGLKVAPQMGDLLAFDNVDAAGAPHPRSRHAGLPVASGTKWIATRWIRAAPTSAWALSDEARAASS
ncbi:2OG-Fe(II) oxygenase [Sphingomonas sp. HITSZ_GF]|uniref:prolyl hydroxylase family protein n=1 Tax=Sphingomonas sp. HITSZ_GF TaxID=3037247 RepID=UPI00240E9409|nr:2OG-Fe(II) oxygenase [Sphingomonas sp. HITSZ_GF]MDG2534742.1 2OG-Fe(II) oxygenase [Sphingomonas sp. HITSZ_GF]